MWSFAMHFFLGIFRVITFMSSWVVACSGRVKSKASLSKTRKTSQEKREVIYLLDRMATLKKMKYSSKMLKLAEKTLFCHFIVMEFHHSHF